MFRLLIPKLYKPSIYEVDLSSLREENIQGIILDLDNTLVPWGEKEASKEVIDWIDLVKSKGFRLCLVSNSLLYSRKINSLAKSLKIPAVGGALKPFPRAFRRATQIMNTPSSQTAVIGDQIFTDILGGNYLGMYTILVTPLSPKEFFTTRIMRRIERIVLPKHC